MTGNEVEILLVENNANDAELTLRALKKNNCANCVVHARDGAEALEFIFGADASGASGAIENKPKVILLDLKLPKIDGIEVLTRLKSDERTKMIPVVVMTSSNEDSDLLACSELGANSYIVKPVKFESFAKTVSELGFYWLLMNQAP